MSPAEAALAPGILASEPLDATELADDAAADPNLTDQK